MSGFPGIRIEEHILSIIYNTWVALWHWWAKWLVCSNTGPKGDGCEQVVIVLTLGPKEIIIFFEIHSTLYVGVK